MGTGKIVKLVFYFSPFLGKNVYYTRMNLPRNIKLVEVMEFQLSYFKS